GFAVGSGGKGLSLSINSTIINPSNTGIEMGTIVFDTFLKDETPFTSLTGKNVVLAAKSNNEVTFNGDVTDISVLLKLIQVPQPTLKVVGKSVDPPKAAGSPVPWLQIPFSKL